MSYGNRVFLGHLSDDARERDVEKFFKDYGHIEEIILKEGYAFVVFEDSRDADDAIYELNGKDLCGKRVTLEFSRGSGRDSDRYRDNYRGRGFPGGFRGRGGKRPNWLDKYGAPIRTGYRVIVENLSSRVSWQDLKDYIRPVAEVTYADAHKIRKNEGTVEFASREDMKRAIEKLDNTEINGRCIRLIDDSYAHDKRHKRSNSRSRDNSRRRRSNSRSRSRDSRKSRSRSRSQSRASKSRSKSHASKSRASKSQSKSRASKSRSKSRS